MLKNRKETNEEDIEETNEEETEETNEEETEETNEEETEESSEESSEKTGTAKVGESGESERSSDKPTDYNAEAAKILRLASELKLEDSRALESIQKRMSYEDFLHQIINVTVDTQGNINVREDAQYEGLDVEEKDIDSFRVTDLILGTHPDFSDKIGGKEREICKAESQKRSEAGIETAGFAIPGSITGSLQFL